MISMNSVYEKNPDVVFRKIADEYILIPIRQKVGDLESIYTLNEVSARIWELIDGKRTVKSIKETIVQEFDVTAVEAEKDIIQFITQLEKIEGTRQTIKK